MITLSNDRIEFHFPEVHPEARLGINFQRTLRIPDDGKNYPLPPGLGEFPLRHAEDYSDTLSEAALKKGGVLLPLYQSEALWIKFDGRFVTDHYATYPFAIQVGTGKVCAVTGEEWTDALLRNVQNYMVVPGQPWLDGYCVEKGIIRQFVAAPLGEGATTEEQITGKARHGGLQIQVFPMKRDAFEEHYPKLQSTDLVFEGSIECKLAAPAMGLAPGGRMRQEIYRDRFRRDEWDTDSSSRCFVHLLNSRQWQSITGEAPPHKPMKAADYAEAGLPWFDYYDDKLKSVKATKTLSRLKGLSEVKKPKPVSVKKGLTPQDLPVVRLGPSKAGRPVHDGEF